MATFSGPFKVKAPFSERVYFEVGVSGTTSFAGGTFAASSSAIFAQSPRVGGSPGTSGTLIVAQQVTIAAINSAGNPAVITVPVGSDILAIFVDPLANFNAGGLGVTAAVIEVGVSASTAMLAVLTPVSASTGPRITATPNSKWRQFTSYVGNGDASGTILAFVSAQTQAVTAFTAGEAILTVQYIAR